ncbi:NAD(P)-dependent oxidoreductase [Pedobacter sp.]|uniref:NAD(P)-dependent oxidoreductase n=1 Tax=Pedobacter sp. TaxID=1411316 RepID=UPI00396CAA24
MKVVVIGATGFVGKNLVNELANRGHQILAIARNIEKAETKMNVEVKSIDINNSDDLKRTIEGADAVISAFNAGWTNPHLYHDFIKGAENIQKAVAEAGVKRFIVVGGAGSLYVDGKQLVDGADFPENIKPGATAARDYLEILKKENNLDWTYFSPAIEMHPGIEIGRTGHYRLGLESPVFDENGHSVLSVEDVAVVVADELEQNKHIKQRFTAAY